MPLWKPNLVSRTFSVTIFQNVGSSGEEVLVLAAILRSGGHRGDEVARSRHDNFPSTRVYSGSIVIGR